MEYNCTMGLQKNSFIFSYLKLKLFYFFFISIGFTWITVKYISGSFLSISFSNLFAILWLSNVDRFPSTNIVNDIWY